MEIERDPYSVPKVYAAINAVQAALARVGISKDGRNTQQNYQFRGIDAVYGALAPLLASQGLCILPRVLTRTVTEQQSKNGGLLFYVVLEVEYDFVAVSDGSKHTIRVAGEAMDSGDKATNKAMSAAYKYAALQTFCIPTEGDNDADATTHELRVSPLPDTDHVAPDLASKIADAFRTHLNVGNSRGIYQVHLDAKDEGEEAYSAAWKLLKSDERAAIKRAIDQEKGA